MSHSEKIWLVQVDQPLCRHRYGNTPCTAVLDADNPNKCYNTRKTCQDPDNYAPDDQVTLTLSQNQAGLVNRYDFRPLLPCIESISLTPVELNLGTMNRSASPLGEREVLQLACSNFKHSDERLDPYREQRIVGAAQYEEGGTAQGGSFTTLTLAAGANGANDYYNGKGVAVHDGSGRWSRITDYVGSTKVATVDTWHTNRLPWATDLSNAAWSKVGLTPVANGMYWTLEDDDGAAYEYIHDTITVPNNSDIYLVGVRVKKTDGDGHFSLLRVNLSGGTTPLNTNDLQIDTNNGAIQRSGPADIDAGIIDRGDYWDAWISVQNNGTGNTSAQVSFYPAVGLGTVGSGYTSAATGSKDVIGFVFDDNQTGEMAQFINTEGTAFASPPGSGDAYTIGSPVDPYERGTFWGKWIARNPYYQNFAVRSYEGDIDDDFSALQLRVYRMYALEGPSDGRVTIELKDLISVVERNRAFVPAVNTGRLDANISSSATSLTLDPAGIGDAEYPASGKVSINDEVISFTRVGDVLTLTGRGLNGTPPAAHDQEDTVQLCYEKVSTLAKDIIYDLLLNYTSLESANLPLSEWNTEMAAVTGLYSGILVAPTPVFDVVSEICEQVGITMFPDTGSDTIKMIPLRAQTALGTLTDDDLIGQVDKRPLNEQRVSQLWVYYGERNPHEDLEEAANFRSRAVSADLPAAGPQQYGTTQVREIFSRWIGQFGRTLALDIGDRLLQQFRDPPLEAQFRVNLSKLPIIKLARPITLITDEVESATGEPKATTQVVVAIERDRDELEVKTQQLQLVQADITDERIIYIDTDVADVDMRAIHDTLYAAPTGVENVTFRVLSGVIVRAGTSTAVPAMKTGSWPSGVTLRLENDGRIQGYGGAGGAGGSANGSTAFSGSPGATGGDALLVTYALTINNTNGELWAGGGGGGGGGGAWRPTGPSVAGGGGGGGAVAFAGGGPGGGTSGGIPAPGSAGGTASLFNPGSGGAGGGPAPLGAHAGDGGAGGTPGSAGSTGQGGIVTSVPTSGGAGGAAGNYVNGNSLVTWEATGSRLGNVV